MIREEKMFSEREGGLEVTARTIWLGNDLLVVLTGGVAHVGAVVVAPAAQEEPHCRSADQVSVISLFAHKEDVVAKGMAEKLSGKLGRTVTIVAGMHWDNLGKEGIDTVVRLCKKLEERMAEELAV